MAMNPLINMWPWIEKYWRTSTLKDISFLWSIHLQLLIEKLLHHFHCKAVWNPVSLSSACLAAVMFPQRRLHGVLFFLIGPIHMFPHLPGWPPPHPLRIVHLIDSSPQLRRGSLDVVAWRGVSRAATPMQWGTLRAGRRVSGDHGQSHQGNYPSSGVRGTWSDFSTFELNTVHRLWTIQTASFKAHAIHRALSKSKGAVRFQGVNCWILKERVGVGGDLCLFSAPLN